MPWFGSETLTEALNYCQQVGNSLSLDDIFAIPATLPACQFGFESAWEDLNSPPPPKNAFQVAYLLPAGESALHRWQKPYQQGGRTFKWKIGVYPLDRELEIFQQLRHRLPADCALRLDANGGLTEASAKRWLKVLDQTPGVEFLEQPLPPSAFLTLQQLADTYQTPLALDESVATIEQLLNAHQQGWRGVFVVKAAIAGSPQKLRKLCHTYPLTLVFSSVFESEVGTKAALRLAADLASPQYALGYGVDHFFA